MIDNATMLIKAVEALNWLAKQFESKNHQTSIDGRITEHTYTLVRSISVSED